MTRRLARALPQPRVPAPIVPSAPPQGRSKRNDEGRPKPPLDSCVWRRRYCVDGPTWIFAIVFVNWFLTRIDVPVFGTFTPVQPTW